MNQSSHISWNAPRFFCSDLTGDEISLDERESRHAQQVLRLRAGDALVVFDGRGTVVRGRLRAATPAEDARNRGTRRREAIVTVEERAAVERPTHRLTVLVAACKGERLDWLVEKCTELGVYGITLVEFERSVVRIGPTHVEKLRRAALETCKQCRRAWQPEIHAGMTLADALRAVSPAAQASQPEQAIVVAHPVDGAAPIGDWLSLNGSSHRQLVAIVGPEGGLTDSEINLIRGPGGQVVRLADTILRVETAAVSIAANWAAHTLRES